MRVLGIDPGLRNTGFGVIELTQAKQYYISSGVIETNSKDNLAMRLNTIFQGITEVINTYQPKLAAIEKVFVNINPNSTLLLGQARGAALCAVANSGLLMEEYTALQIKQALVGYGRASKTQIQQMVIDILSLNQKPQADAADALACAITYAQSRKFTELIRRV